MAGEVALDDLRQQVGAQYRAVVHMATALATVHSQIAPMINAGVADELLPMRGERSAEIMEVLGNILNGMDANDPDEDSWIDPIFAKAHELFPAGASMRLTPLGLEVKKVLEKKDGN